jgi:REP element-mobilizing transposase RayT
VLSQRRSIRLKTHDYSSGGLYSITIIAARRQRLFSRVEGSQVSLTAVGRIIEQEWLRIPIMRPRAWLDVYVIMPDHFHGIVGLEPPDGGILEAQGSLASVIGGFKSACTSRYRESIADPNARLWHRGFYEHWVRGSGQLARIRRYILNNPRNWGRSRTTRSGR